MVGLINYNSVNVPKKEINLPKSPWKSNKEGNVLSGSKESPAC